jgi:hypothetical protein
MSPSRQTARSPATYNPTITWRREPVDDETAAPIDELEATDDPEEEALGDA